MPVILHLLEEKRKRFVGCMNLWMLRFTSANDGLVKRRNVLQWQHKPAFHSEVFWAILELAITDYCSQTAKSSRALWKFVTKFLCDPESNIVRQSFEFHVRSGLRISGANRREKCTIKYHSRQGNKFYPDLYNSDFYIRSAKWNFVCFVQKGILAGEIKRRPSLGHHGRLFWEGYFLQIFRTHVLHTCARFQDHKRTQKNFQVQREVFCVIYLSISSLFFFFFFSGTQNPLFCLQSTEESNTSVLWRCGAVDSIIWRKKHFLNKADQRLALQRTAIVMTMSWSFCSVLMFVVSFVFGRKPCLLAHSKTAASVSKVSWCSQCKWLGT